MFDRVRRDVAQYLQVTGSTGFPSKRPSISGDRKSTRLNSSHSQISYAVFCLKKKKKNLILHILLAPIQLFTLMVLISLPLCISGDQTPKQPPAVNYALHYFTTEFLRHMTTLTLDQLTD